MKLKYYYNLDGLRGIAAIVVVIFHFFSYPLSNYIENIKLYQKLTEFGQHGVSMFFVLSGFVITRILINTREDKDYFKRFYINRSVRILPLYYLFLVLYYSFYKLYSGSFIDFELQIPFYIYIQNFGEIFNIQSKGPGHFWSLAVEEHFYLLWPLIVYLINPKYLIKFIGISIILIFLLKYIMLSNSLSINKFTFTRIDQILMGSYIAILELNNFFTKKRALIKIFLISSIVIPIGIFIYFFKDQFLFIKDIFKYTVLGILFFSLISVLIILDTNCIINKFLSSRIMQYFGKISYGLYVWHILVILIVEKYLLTEIIIIDLSVVILLTIVLSHLSYYYYEIHFLKLKKKKV